MERLSLKVARVAAGLKQTDVAAALKVSRKTVAAWESGRSMPTVDKVEAICALLGRSYDAIQWKV